MMGNNMQPTRIKSFFRQNQNNPKVRIILPLVYTFLGVLYFYSLLFRDVGSGVHVLRDNINRNITQSSARIWDGSGTSSELVPLEPRSLADVSIANAEVAWKKQIQHQNYLRRRAEKKEEQRMQRENAERLARLAKEANNTMSSSSDVADARSKNATGNHTTGQNKITFILANGTERVLVLHTLTNQSSTKVSKDFNADEYVKNLSRLSVKRTPSRRRMGQTSHGSSPGQDTGFLPVMIMVTMCTIFRVCINVVITRISGLDLSSDSDEEDDDATTPTLGRAGRSDLSSFFSGGREARLLRRRARAVRANRMFQRFADRLNAERAANGEREISAETLRHLVNARDFNGNDYDRLHDFVEENGPSQLSFLSAIGATEAEINRCPSRTLKPGDDLLRPTSRLGQEQQCSICLERYQIGETVRTIPCFHTFHCSCIDPWLATKSECPICKHSAIG